MKPQLFFALGVLALGTTSIVYADAPVEDYSTEAGSVNTTPATPPATQNQTSTTQVWQELKKENPAPQSQAKTSASSAPSETSINTANMTLEQRISRLEQQTNYLNKNNPQAQIEDLQQKLQKVSGDLETQQHKIDQQEKQLNDFYTDLDQRIKSKNTPARATATEDNETPTSNSAGTKGRVVHQQSTQEQKNKFVTKQTKKIATSNKEQEAKTKNAAEEDDSTTASAPYVANTVNPSDSSSTANNTNEEKADKKDALIKEQQAYQAALNDLRNKKFTTGAQKLKTYITAYPNGTYAANAHYWLGEINFLNNSYAKASSEFDAVVSKYPSSPKIPEAWFKLAYIHDKQGKHDQAQKEYRAIKKRYPNSSAAKLADQQLQQQTTPATSTSTDTTTSQ